MSRHFSSNTEIWKTIAGYSAYEASNTGFIRFKRTQRVLKGQNKGNFIRVYIKNDRGGHHNAFVHRLVGITFASLIDDASKFIVSHKGSNTHNNSIGNLKVSSRQDLSRSVMRKIGSRWVEVLLQEIQNDNSFGKTIKFESISACERYCRNTLGIESNIYRCVRNKIILNSSSTDNKYQLTISEQSRYDNKVANVDSGECWKRVCEGLRKQVYYVSNYGRVKVQYPVSKNERLLKQFDIFQYKRCNIHDGERHFYAKVHQLVAHAFIPNPLNCTQVDHRDCNPSNNRASNLRWVKNQQENLQNDLTQAKFREKRVNKPVLQIDANTNEIIRNFESAREAELLNPKWKSQSILVACRDQTRNRIRYGYMWRFAE